MRIVGLKRIYDEENEFNNLFAVQWEGQELDELNRAFDKWHDLEYLKSFFKENEKDLTEYASRYFHKDFPYTIKKAIERTKDDAYKCEDILREIPYQKEKNKPYSLNSLFKPYHNAPKFSISRSEYLQPNKYKGIPPSHHTWIRLYAIRISAEIFVITGSAIKLTATNQQAEHTNLENKKMDEAVRYLKNHQLSNPIAFEGLTNDDFGYLDIEI
jgi:hypothetical protein